MNASKKLVSLILATALLCSVACVLVPTAKADTVNLTVYAMDYLGRYYDVPLYIDDEYVGNTNNVYAVSTGTHEIYVIPDICGILIFQGFYYNGNYYGDPITISISSDAQVIAYYYNYLG